MQQAWQGSRNANADWESFSNGMCDRRTVAEVEEDGQYGGGEGGLEL